MPREELDTVYGSFTTHAPRMQYHKYLAAGCPIATSVIEGACRRLAKDRLECSDMRWTLNGTQAMLDLRAVHQSSYWIDFHQDRVLHQQASFEPFRSVRPLCLALTA